MVPSFNVSEDVERLISNIISKNKWEPVTDIKYQPGSEAGDGYASKTIAVDIPEERDTHKLFLKCPLSIKSTDDLPIHKLYENEAYFYDVVRPAFLKFVRERGVENGFRNAPKCFGTSPKNAVALENLRHLGYTLFDRRRFMNDEHIVLVLRTFAKFHAISFAFKDQDRERYEKLVENTFDVFGQEDKAEEKGFLKMIRIVIEDTLAKMDPVEDRRVLDRCKADDLVACLSSASRSLNEYSILTQGDCWCNNMMFLYEDDNEEQPVDIMLIDWQVLREASPVFDISYFFYTIASEKVLRDPIRYLKVYHDELSKQIRELGSDPDVVYPFQILEKEWKQHCRYGFAMAFMLTKAMLSKKTEVIDFEAFDFENPEAMKNPFPKIEKEEQYMARMRMLSEHMILNNYI